MALRLTIITACKVSVFGVFLVRIQSKCEKIQTRKTPNTNTFYAVYSVLIKLGFNAVVTASTRAS